MSTKSAVLLSPAGPCRAVTTSIAADVRDPGTWHGSTARETTVDARHDVADPEHKPARPISCIISSFSATATTHDTESPLPTSSRNH